MQWNEKSSAWHIGSANGIASMNLHNIEMYLWREVGGLSRSRRRRRSSVVNSAEQSNKLLTAAESEQPASLIQYASNYECT